MTIELTSVVTHANGQISTEVDGEVLMLSVEKGNYYGLDDVGSRIWHLIAEPRSVSDVCGQLVREFEVDDANCRADVLRLLNELEQHALIKTVSG